MRDHGHLIIATLFSSLSGPVLADLLEPAPIDLGPFNLIPTLELQEIYDDNFYRRANSAADYHIQIVDLQLEGVALDGPHEYRAQYLASAGFIGGNSDDNYVDHSARLQGKWQMATRHRMELRASYEEQHNRRGTGYFQGDAALSIDKPARYRREGAMARYIYGADKARGQLQFELNASNKTYLNFREFTAIRDLAHVYGSGTFLWRVVGSLRGLVEVRYGDINYQNDPASISGVADTLDSTHTDYLAGVTWEITGRTTGTIKVGHTRKEFADRDRDDFSGGSWSGEIEWLPRSYSRFSLLTGRRPEETVSTGNFVDTTDIRLRWEHQWNDRVESRVDILRRDEDHKASVRGREDETVLYSAGVDYAMRRWLVIGAYYNHEKRDSNLDEFTFSRDVAGLSLQMSL